MARHLSWPTRPGLRSIAFGLQFGKEKQSLQSTPFSSRRECSCLMRWTDLKLPNGTFKNTSTKNYLRPKGPICKKLSGFNCWQERTRILDISATSPRHREHGQHRTAEQLGDAFGASLSEIVVPDG